MHVEHVYVSNLSEQCDFRTVHIYPPYYLFYITNQNNFKLGIVMNIDHCRAVLCSSFIDSPSLLQENSQTRVPEKMEENISVANVRVY